MGSCIICGTEVSGEICRSHEEDVYFEFEGSSPDELTVGRFYRGTVDGFADFGVFIDIGDNVTGLLHTSELDRRLEGLDWEPGDTIFVQVKNVRDNGNVDLGWSIRQRPREFRGGLLDDGETERQLESTEPLESVEPSPEPEGTEEPGMDERVAPDDHVDEPTPPEPQGGESSSSGIDVPDAGGAAAVETRIERESVDTLAEQVGSMVIVEGKLTEITQTNGPTVFELTDETGSIDCPAFESAGVRAYPEVNRGDIVRIRGEVEERRGDLQIETGALTVLNGDDRDAVTERIDASLTERAAPTSDGLLAVLPGIEGIADELSSGATRIRRAVFDQQPIVVRHSATVDGYVAGVALERAVLALLETEYEESDAVYHYFDRRPLEDRVYSMQDAMRDTTRLLMNRDRHDEQPPLVVFVNTASTAESVDSLALLGLYEADRLVIDDTVSDAVRDETECMVTLDGAPGTGEAVSVTAVCANIGAMVNDSVRGDLQHLPAVSYWRNQPSTIRELAESAGFDTEEIKELREAIALEAFYQAYEDKRELITDLLFNDHPLVSHASAQYRDRITAEIRTAKPHLDLQSIAAYTVGVLDTDAFTHQYDFPPVKILLAELAGEVNDVDAVAGVGTDELCIWSDGPIDLGTVADALADAVPDGGVTVRGGRDGKVVFLHGARDNILDALPSAVGTALD